MMAAYFLVYKVESNFKIRSSRTPCCSRSDSDEEFAIKSKHFRRHRKSSLMSNGESEDGEDQVPQHLTDVKDPCFYDEPRPGPDLIKLFSA